MLIIRKFPAADLDNWTIGMLINYCYAYDRQIKRMKGETVHDPEEQYYKLKNMQPQIEKLYASGQIKKYKYDSFVKSLTHYEELLRD